MLLSGVCQSWFGMAFSNNNSLTGVFQQAPSSLDGHNNSAELSSILGRNSFAALFSVSENTSFFTRPFVVKFGFIVLVTVHWSTMELYLSHCLCVTSPSKLQLGVLNSVVCFAAIAVAMLLSMFCGMTDMESCPDRFQSLCASSVWLGIFPQSNVWFSLVPGAPASLLKMVFCSLLLVGVVILTFLSFIEDRCEGMGKEKWCTQGSKTVLYPKRKFHFPQASQFSIQVACVLQILLQVARKLCWTWCGAWSTLSRLLQLQFP